MVKRNEHRCDGGKRYYACDQCDFKYKVKDNYVKHRLAKHPSGGVVVRKNVGMEFKKEPVAAGTLEMNDDYEDFGEFIIDALYLDKGQFSCRVRNFWCFTTDNALEMKAHREKYHLILEQRIPFEKWKHSIPARFVNNIEEDVKEEIKNEESIVVSKDDKDDIDPMIKDRKDFVEYLHKMAPRYVGR